MSIWWRTIFEIWKRKKVNSKGIISFALLYSIEDITPLYTRTSSSKHEFFPIYTLIILVRNSHTVPCVHWEPNPSTESGPSHWSKFQLVLNSDWGKCINKGSGARVIVKLRSSVAQWFILELQTLMRIGIKIVFFFGSVWDNNSSFGVSHPTGMSFLHHDGKLIPA